MGRPAVRTQPKGKCCTTVIGCICSFFIGLSVFVATESIYVQSQLYTYCFMEGKQFVGYSGVFLFLPGLLINVLNPLLLKCRANMGLRCSTLISIVVSYLVLWATMGTYFYIQYKNGVLENPFIIYFLEILIGLSVSFCFASHTPLMSILQSNFYVAFTLGLYAPSTVVMLPTNLLVGSMCSCKSVGFNATENITTVVHGSTNFMCTTCVYSVNWGNLVSFYMPVVGTQLLGLVCFIIISALPESRGRLQTVNTPRRNTLQRAVARGSNDPEVLEENLRRQFFPATKQGTKGEGVPPNSLAEHLLVPGAGRASSVDKRTLSLDETSQGQQMEDVVGALANLDLDESSLDGSSGSSEYDSDDNEYHDMEGAGRLGANSADRGGSAMGRCAKRGYACGSGESDTKGDDDMLEWEDELPGSEARRVALQRDKRRRRRQRRRTYCAVLGRIKLQFFTVIFNTIASQALVALNPFLDSRTVEDLSDTLMYMYYGCTALGVILCFVPFIMRTKAVLLFVTCLLRIGYSCFIYVVVVTMNADIVSTVTVLSAHSASYLAGGLIFAASFPSAVREFKDVTRQIKASSLLNIAYFLSICLTSIPEVFLNDEEGNMMNASNTMCFS